ncbi:HpcH/HpaI aldolase/citrate lyase family protein [Cohaesibacter gelatinilyticus]|uniref:Citrate lyase subunit beta / citryl-CoA lyase n=1 Tax=Cohaesibacter gelatinilyticus TaxID=372072 RepID=A0A285NKQ2_9HYPH|nr:CoA ester lyase [Cohaesibacter gelatinilyticus]SNZ08456.1 citrate lyase subunit beta / citryl-CoA lyase [Cohaesibacter gelatinilyticus]
MRSYLFVPGDSEKKLAKGLGSEADVLLIDLEDSVALSNKAEARKIAAAFVKTNRDQKDRPLLFVRVNALDTGLTDEDLTEIIPAAPDGIMVPKTLSGQCITRIDAKVTAQEALAGIPEGSIKLMAVATETASSIFTLGTYGGSSSRLSALTWGAEDLSADLGAETNKDDDGNLTSPYKLVRELCLFGSVAAGVQPVDSIYANFRDMDGLRAEATTARRDGYTGKMAIHPAQVSIINDVFTPSDLAISQAKRIIAAFGDAGDIGVIGLDGEMLDRPHLRRAETVLQRAKSAGISVD